MRTYGTKHTGQPVEEIPALMRADIKQALADGTLPAGLKVSVRRRRVTHEWAIDMTVTAYPGQALNDDLFDWVQNADWAAPMPPGRYTAEMSHTLDVLREIHSAYNYDGSDPMTDYFDVHYYGRVDVSSDVEAHGLTEEAA